MDQRQWTLVKIAQLVCIVPVRTRHLPQVIAMLAIIALAAQTPLSNMPLSQDTTLKKAPMRWYLVQLAHITHIQLNQSALHANQAFTVKTMEEV
jgi:hypothetical protein